MQRSRPNQNLSESNQSLLNPVTHETHKKKKKKKETEDIPKDPQENKHVQESDPADRHASPTSKGKSRNERKGNAKKTIKIPITMTKKKEKGKR